MKREKMLRRKVYGMGFMGKENHSYYLEYRYATWERGNCLLATNLEGNIVWQIAGPKRRWEICSKNHFSHNGCLKIKYLGIIIQICHRFKSPWWCEIDFTLWYGCKKSSDLASYSKSYTLSHYFKCFESWTLGPMEHCSVQIWQFK